MKPNRARDILRASEGRRVLLVGDLMMDEWVFGSVKRISPEAPIPVVNMPLTPEARADKPGGAGNVAAILLGLGAAVRVVGVVGEDAYGERLLADLKSRGADVSDVIVDPSRPTTHKMRIIAGRQQLLRIDTERADPMSPAVARELRDRLRANLAQADAVLAADYAKGVLSETSLPSDLIAQARESGLPFCADPKPANIQLFRGASLVSPNEAEALEASGAVNSARGAAGPSEAGPSNAGPPEAGPLEEGAEVPAGLSMSPAVVRAGRHLRALLASEAVFITRGEHGIAVFCEDGAITEVPAQTGLGVVGDGTGCGDAVAAVAALALAAGAGYVEAAKLANAAGGVVSRFVGVHSPEPSEIVDWLEARPS